MCNNSDIKRVLTSSGSYLGRDLGDISVFLGISYAKPPVGQLRWKPPVKKEVVEDFPAFEFGPSCVQPVDPVELASVREQSEDCLSLNIWASNRSGGKKPVMVFIHGGGYIGGGSSDPLYNGEMFPRRHDVVFVSINYRCNVLGFIDLEDFGGPDYAQSKNLGILDQICALEWIKNNIEDFGGDPENVTIFGESAGSGSVSMLLVCPMARGLFHKAICESGPMLMHKTAARAKEHARDFIRISGAKTMEELLSKSSDEIRDIHGELAKLYGYRSEIMFAPVADGVLIPEEPFKALEAGLGADVPLMIGTTANELNYWKLYYDNLETEMEKFLFEQFDVMRPDIREYGKLLAAYLAADDAESLGQRYINLSNEVMFRIPSIKVAELHSRRNPTWMYRFDWPSKIPGLGACHAVEVPFVFHILDSESGVSFSGKNPPEALACQVQDAWVAFAENSDPNHPGIPRWEKYSEDSRSTMIINETWNSENDPGRDTRILLREIFE